MSIQRLVLLVCLFTATPAFAQVQPVTASGRQPLAREGFWFSGGLGYGTIGCSDCDGVRLSGLSGGLSLGTTVNPKFLFGIGTTGFARSIDGSMLRAGTFDARIRFYPSLYNGFHINGGLGLGSVSFEGVTEFGAGAMFGIGWDIRVSPNVSLTPFYNGFAMASDLGDANVGQIGLGITIH